MKHVEPKKLVVTNLNEVRQKQIWAVLKESGQEDKVPSIVDRIKKFNKKETNNNKYAYVLTFNGDMRATEAEDFSKAVTIIMSSGEYCGEVFIKLTSGGGTVNGYGLLSSEIKRLRDANLKVTVLIDQVAASGGYLAACVADEVVAAPFSYIGSIGVVSSIPNINRLLKEKGVSVEEHTAGDKKRNITMMGETTDEDRNAHKKDLENIHAQFKSHVETYRKDISELSEEIRSEVFSGAYWTALHTVDNNYGLVDRLSTSEEFLAEKMKALNVLEISFEKKKEKKGIFAKVLGSLVSGATDEILEKVETRLYQTFMNGKGLN